MKRISIFVLLFSIAVTAIAKPAYRGAITRTLEDGTEKTVFLHGNEHFHYMTDSEGQWLNETTLQPMTETQKAERLDQAIAAGPARAPQQRGDVGGKPNLAPYGIVILVNFQDKEFKTPKDTIDSMMIGANFTRDYAYRDGGHMVYISARGSARQYFIDQSYGQYTPVFDIVGPVTVSHDMAYYGENDAWGNDKHPEQMIKEACELANSQYDVDFTKYDNDGDNKVDFVYVIYAGFAEADGGASNTIWPHSYNLSYSGISCYVDGKRVDKYACGSELAYASGVYDGVGTFTHEYSHVMGLPDFYATNDATHRTLADWDIMDAGTYNNGGNTPPAYSAYERFYMGWLTPRVLGEPESVWLNPINFEEGESLMICEGDEHNLVGWNPNPKEFYMLEARVPHGWDKYLPGEGMLITHITYNQSKWQNNTVNNTKSSMGVDMIEAKTNNTQKGKMTDAFPDGATEWVALEGHEVTQINIEEGGAVTFCYRGAEKSPIENVQTGETATKILRDGKVFILRNGVMYDVNGAVIRNY